MEKGSHKHHPSMIVSASEATAFLIGYVLLTAVLAVTVFNEIRDTYIINMSIGLLLICLAKLWVQKRN